MVMADSTSWTRQIGVPKDTTKVLVSPSSAILQIPIDQICPSPHQVRRHFDEEGIKSLAESIAIEGLIQPITVRKVEDGYELIAGERRLRAVKKLGLPAIDARVIDVISEASASAKGLVENLQRQDLNPIEEAEGFDLLHRLDSNYWTHERISGVAGRSRSYVTQSLSFLKLPERVKDDVRRLTLNRSQILDIARLLTPEAQILASERAKGLSWKETRHLVDSMLSGKIKKKVNSEGTENPSPAMPAPYNPLSNIYLLHRLMPTTTEEFRWAEEDQKNLWLPNNNEEAAELENLAKQSSGSWPVYARIFGEKSFIAQKMAAFTWTDLGVEDQVTGCQQIIHAIRTAQKR